MRPPTLAAGDRPRPGPAPPPRRVERPPLPRRRLVSVIGPMRVRTRRTTGWPTASHMRRTWRLRPSWITSRMTLGGGQRRLRRRRQPVVELDALAQPPQGAARRRALDLGQVLLLDAEDGMGEPVGELAVVGEQQQPLGVGVEAADREDPGLGRHQVDHGRPALRVVGRRHDAGRLVAAGSGRGPGRPPTRAPSTSTTSRSESTRWPRSATSPLTVTRPSRRGPRRPPAADAGPGQHLLELLVLSPRHPARPTDRRARPGR